MNLKKYFARLLGVAVTFAVCCYLLKLGVTFLAEIWIGLTITTVAAISGGIAYRIYKYWRDTRR